MAIATLCPSPERFNNVQFLPPAHAVSAEPRTFRETAESYLEHGGERRYLAPIIACLGDRPLRTIFPFDLRQLAEGLYPNASNATRNRQALTPARAVILHGYDRGWCELIRVRRFKEDKPKRRKPASSIWLHSFARQCDRDELGHLSALVLFMATTGARISEAIALRWTEVDLTARSVLLLKTKTSTNSTRYLTDEVARRMRELERTSSRDDRVFRYANRHSVNERIKAVCDRAEIPYKPPHTCGRHTFASTAIELGMDIKTTMVAGGWESSSVFLETYVHPRGTPGRVVADRMNVQDFGEM